MTHSTNKKEYKSPHQKLQNSAHRGDDDTNSARAYRSFGIPTSASIRPIEPWRASPSKKNTLSVRNSTSRLRSLLVAERVGAAEDGKRRLLVCQTDRAPRLSQDVSSRGVPQRKGDNGKIDRSRYISCICRHYWRRDGRAVNGGHIPHIFCLRSPRSIIS